MLSAKKEELDREFDSLLSFDFQKISNDHWTPADVALMAAKWLGKNPKSEVLDVGSGVGKFCIIGATVSSAHFTGIELRKNLFEEAELIQQKKGIKNISFLNENITSIDLGKFNAFYYYNPFGEHMAVAGWIDKSITFSEKTFNDYEGYFHKHLSGKQIGTRVATYFSPSFYLPDSYYAVEILFDGNLIFWEKIK
jgi:hypothetical protein